MEDQIESIEIWDPLKFSKGVNWGLKLPLGVCWLNGIRPRPYHHVTGWAHGDISVVWRATVMSSTRGRARIVPLITASPFQFHKNSQRTLLEVGKISVFFSYSFKVFFSPFLSVLWHLFCIFLFLLKVIHVNRVLKSTVGDKTSIFIHSPIAQPGGGRGNFHKSA